MIFQHNVSEKAVQAKQKIEEILPKIEVSIIKNAMHGTY